MLRAFLATALAAAAVAASAPIASAHHTFVAKYDGSKTVTVSGVVTSVSFSNPHIHFTLTAGGTTWTVETESISVVQGRGLTQRHLKEGAKATVTGWKARDGSPELGLQAISIVGGPSVTVRRSAR